MRFVIVPQAIRRVIPPLLNDFIGLQKDTALVSILGVVEVFGAQIRQSATFNYTPYVITAIIFIALTIPMARLVDWLARATAAPGASDRPMTSAASDTDAGPAGRPLALRISGLRSPSARPSTASTFARSPSTRSSASSAHRARASRPPAVRQPTEPVDAGRIEVGGEEITARGVDVDRLRRRIGIVFQSYNLFPHLRVLDNVTLGPRRVLGRRRGEAEAAAVELLRRFGLEDKQAEYPDRLSGGQQQRVAIVRALAMEPGLLLLGEITSALDPVLVAEVLDVVRELAAGGMTMLIATHEMGFARDVADRVAFLDGGRILEIGPPETILSSPREPRTQQFLQRVIAAGRLGA